MNGPDQPAVPEGVGITALVTAYARAQESRAAQPRFVDPYAEQFVGAATGVATDGRLPRLGPARDDGSSALWESLFAYFAGRTPFYDRFVLDAGVSQIVVLGAGSTRGPSACRSPPARRCSKWTVRRC
ncbi:class I SAM-dependent methyltransferase [Amycolatopsis rhabdoformis]|uniref:Class I SAM-dependent methyltransferase n=1 Tax=Amycolatopsis rhabdoformis TaxID=1448059 RepID=A0ABZ1IB85_9PSEU|nr:class I SAM-dependent methyltransferase [Amycolatopsis rhabdoformis]WSE31281.1 class I SAM-dependent methyltransferase [Amycolatopsis rhabdoformis]